MSANEINTGLINECLANNRAAQRKLYDILLPYLNVVCKRYLRCASDLPDALQEAFIRIFRHLSSYDAEKASLKTWATRIVIHCCLQKNAARSRQHTEELVDALCEPTDPPAVFKTFSDEDVLHWLKTMPDALFEVFNMYAIDGFSHGEIADILGIDEALSRKRLSRARAWLKHYLPEHIKEHLCFY